ncbi:MAG: arylsulfatase, partial [Lentisphaerae bacterium]
MSIAKSLSIIGTLPVLGFCAAGQSPVTKPNIVYILCDDLGYGDVSCLNPSRGKIPTPNIDRLAREGMTFTDAHSGASVCTPSRYGILTGRYAWRSRLQRGVLGGNEAHDPLIAEDQLTVPKFLKRFGYHSACLGKWHLGFKFSGTRTPRNKGQGRHKKDYSSGYPVGTPIVGGPTTRGFDYYLGFHHSKWMKTVIENDRVIAELEPVQMLQYLKEHAIKYIQERARDRKPFFLYLPLNSPHAPIVPSPAWQGKSKLGPYGDFVMETDDVVGQVLDALKRCQLEENTIVIFTSDNGCSYPAAHGEQLEKLGHFPSAQFRGAKSDIWDGGHRLPFIVRWPGRVKPGSTCDALVCHTDLLATCAELLNATLPQDAGEDSISFLPLLFGKAFAHQRKTVIHHSISGRFAIRDKRWKLILCPGSGGWSSPTDAEAEEQHLPEMQLYDMEADCSEQKNL